MINPHTRLAFLICIAFYSTLAYAQSDLNVYDFDYRLQANSTYVITSHSEVKMNNHIEGELDSLEMNFPGMALLNQNTSAINKETQTLTTSAEAGNRLKFRVTVDSSEVIYGNPLQEKIAGSEYKDLKEESLSLITYGHSRNFKRLIIDSSYSEVDKSFTKRRFFDVGGWHAQKDLPSGKMIVGDTFLIVQPPPRRKKGRARHRNLTAKQKARMDSSQLANYEEMQKLGEMLDRAKEEKKEENYYVFKSINNGVASFDYYRKQSSDVPGYMKGSTEINGTAEYNLKDDYFQSYEVNMTTISSTQSETAVLHSETTSHQLITIKRTDTVE